MQEARQAITSGSLLQIRGLYGCGGTLACKSGDWNSQTSPLRPGCVALDK